MIICQAVKAETMVSAFYLDFYTLFINFEFALYKYKNLWYNMFTTQKLNKHHIFHRSGHFTIGKNADFIFSLLCR